MNWLLYVDGIPKWICISMAQAAELAAPYMEDQRAIAIERRASGVTQIWIYDRTTQRWIAEK